MNKALYYENEPARFKSPQHFHMLYIQNVEKTHHFGAWYLFFIPYCSQKALFWYLIHITKWAEKLEVTLGRENWNQMWKTSKQYSSNVYALETIPHIQIYTWILSWIFPWMWWIWHFTLYTVWWTCPIISVLWSSNSQMLHTNLNCSLSEDPCKALLNNTNQWE